MEILEVPFPILGKGQLLIRNLFSVISAGTEGKTVSDARKGYIAKAKSRQKEVAQVIEMIKSQGIKETYDLVMNKLEAPSALGYSCAGEVIGIGEGVNGFEIGDIVACGGKDAIHADVVAVNTNLCVKVARHLPVKYAAFATIASISMQGIRQAELNVGCNCVVIGLGLIGQLTIQILNAAGIKTIGIDVLDEQVNRALKSGAFKAYNRNQEGLEHLILRDTNGFGTDGVIITAGTSSLDPVELAGILCRRKGKVVIVGAVPTGFSRENYYKKELDLRMSSSYGPGRYDSNYEEKGLDYPIGYVRWTENRNMQAFIDLLEAGKLDMEKVITHIFPLENAAAAYNMILERSEPFSGILIAFDTERKLKSSISLVEKQYDPSEVNVGFIGAGSFAQNVLLPRLKGLCNFSGIATAHGNTARYVADKYNFSYCTDNPEEILKDRNINTVFIATRHNLHANYVIQCMKAGKNVFVEKPLAIHKDELDLIIQAKNNLPSDNRARLMVGFNRRFSPFVQKIKFLFPDHQLKTINIRVNAGLMPSNHWVNDNEIGGGRIVGEACHFIDLAMYIAGAPIISIHANGFSQNSGVIDTVSINLKFSNGSIANVNYLANGNKQLEKEYIEVFCDGTVAIIDDFKKLSILGKKNTSIKSKQDKGHQNELNAFTESIKEGKPAPIPFDELILSSLATFKVVDSVNENRVIEF